MKTYHGFIRPAMRLVTVVDDGLPERAIDWRLDLMNHSPTGVCWGYTGSGPAQLALAILADYLQNDKKALSYYQDFKIRVIAHLDRSEDWTLTEKEIFDAILKIKEARNCE